MPTIPDEWLTTKQAAAALELSDSSVRRLVIDGVIPAWRPSERVILIKKADVEKAKSRPKAGNPNFQPKPKRSRKRS